MSASATNRLATATDQCAEPGQVIMHCGLINDPSAQDNNLLV